MLLWSTINVGYASKFIDAFVLRYNRLSLHIKITAESLQGKKLRLFFKGTDLVGGYAINTNVPLRYLEVLSKESKAVFIQNYPEKDCIEIIGFWYLRNKISTLNVCQIYGKLHMDCLSAGKKFILGGSFIKSVRDIHMCSLPKLIHNGLYLYDEHAWEYWVYYGTRTNIVIGFLKMTASILFSVLQKVLKKQFKTSF